MITGFKCILNLNKFFINKVHFQNKSCKESSQKTYSQSDGITNPDKTDEK